MPRRVVLVGTWVGGTLAATVLAWAAVGQVAREVVPTGGLPVPRAAAPTAPSAADAVEAGPGAPTATPPAVGAAAARTEAYELVGGVVAVRYRHGLATLVQATPRAGFRVEVRDAGPPEVEVRFTSDGHESRLVSRWHGGRPDVQRDERPRRGG